MGGRSGTQASYRVREAQDPVAARKREATAGGRVTTEKIAQQPPRSSARAGKAQTTIRSSPRFMSSNTGGSVVLEDMRGVAKRLKKRSNVSAHTTKHSKKDPLQRMHAKLASSDNVDFVKASAATSSHAAAKLLSSVVAVLTGNEGATSGGSNELISPRSADVAPALVSMRQGLEGSPLLSDLPHQPHQPKVNAPNSIVDTSDKP